MSSTPPILYWEPGTLAVIRSVRRLREQDGVPCAFTMDAGANVHVICPPSSEDAVAAAVGAPPAAPSPLSPGYSAEECRSDPTDDALGCASPSPVCQ